MKKQKNNYKRFCELYYLRLQVSFKKNPQKINLFRKKSIRVLVNNMYLIEEN